MSAEVLRRAAALMRERAEAATPSPWEVIWNAVAYVDTIADPSDPTGQTPMQNPEKIADANPTDRVHIASWHPAVALAVSDWLEFAAHSFESRREAERQGVLASVEVVVNPYALAVARAYLGDADV